MEKETITNKNDESKFKHLYDEVEPQYIKSFIIKELDLAKKFLEEYGFVVIRDVINKDQCDKTIEEIWDVVKANSENVDRQDPRTWKKWPGYVKEGLFPYNPVFTKCALENRMSEDIYKIYSYLLDEKSLIINHDRYGMFRPTRNVKISENETKNFPEYSTTPNLHLDMNPWTFLDKEIDEKCDKGRESLNYEDLTDFIEHQYIGSIFRGNESLNLNDIDIIKVACKHLQGLINLYDNVEANGGFQVVPGFHKNFYKFCDETKNSLAFKHLSLSKYVPLPSSLSINKESLVVTSRAGSLIIFSQLLAHGSQPNKNNDFRYAQFIKLYPNNYLSEKRNKIRKEVLLKQLENINVEITELGKKLFGLDPW